jgi:GDP-L-fucose synthase
MAAGWAGLRVLVTGGTGFLGQHLVRALGRSGAHPIPVGRAQADLRDAAQARALVAELRPDVLLHAAVQGGGVGWMKAHPVESGRDNLLMAIHLLDAAKEAGCAAFVGVSSACAYPRDCPVPFREDQLWDGYPEPTNGPYAQAKRVMMDLGAAHEAQHGLRCRFPVLANLYGPGDHLTPERAHVVAGLIQRCLALPPDQPLVVWGTGRATRELLYVKDAADGVLASLGAPDAGPLNIGTGVEVRIAELAAAVVEACGHPGGLRFDPAMPEGQGRKCLAVDKAAALGWRARTPLADGLRRTVAWYRQAGGAP